MKKICVRCHGQKYMYKINAGYSAIDCGGIKVECPLCIGIGFFDEEEARKELSKKTKVSSKKTNKSV